MVMMMMKPFLLLAVLLLPSLASAVEESPRQLGKPRPLTKPKPKGPRVSEQWMELDQCCNVDACESSCEWIQEHPQVQKTSIPMLDEMTFKKSSRSKDSKSKSKSNSKDSKSKDSKSKNTSKDSKSKSKDNKSASKDSKSKNTSKDSKSKNASKDSKSKSKDSKSKNASKDSKSKSKDSKSKNASKDSKSKSKDSKSKNASKDSKSKSKDSKSKSKSKNASKDEEELGDSDPMFLSQPSMAEGLGGKPPKFKNRDGEEDSDDSIDGDSIDDDSYDDDSYDDDSYSDSDDDDDDGSVDKDRVYEDSSDDRRRFLRSLEESRNKEEKKLSRDEIDTLCCKGGEDVPPPPPPPPTDRTIPKTSGDPHFTMFGGHKFDFHGACDLVFLDNPDYNNGQGMKIHMRTKAQRWWSFVQNVVVQIGNDTLEVMGGTVQEHKYWVNGELGPALHQGGVLPFTIGGYKVRYHVESNHKFQFKIFLENGQEIKLVSVKEFMAVELPNHTEESFGSSSGILGTYGYGDMMARDGVTLLEDPIDFGMEWQVTQDEPMLFHSMEGVQHPEACAMPTASEQSRLLGENTVTREEAAKACMDAELADFDDCIFDIMATDDADMASVY